MNGKRFEQLHEKVREVISALQGRQGFPTQDRDDLEQEMALALLALADDCTDSYCLSQAAWAGLKWLRRTYSSEVTGYIRTLSDMRNLIDSGRFRRAWH